MSLDGFSLAFLVAELNQTLVGGRIDKIYQPNKYTLSLIVRQISETVRLLITVKPENPCLFISKTLPENPATPPGFCMLLRKHLEDGRIAALTQYGLDRTIFVDIDVRNERGELVTKRLVIELMGKHSNIIFTQNDTIIDAIRRVGVNLSSVRQILPGRHYEYPPGLPAHNLLHGSVTDFTAQLSQENSLSLAKAIIKITNGIGPVTAREIIWRSGFPADIMVDALDTSDFSALAESIYSLREAVQEQGLKPTLVLDASNRILGMAAFSLEHVTGDQRKTFSNMSQLLEAASQLKGMQKAPEKTVIEKLLASEISKQKRKLAALTAELADANSCDQFRLQADILMANLYTTPERSKQIVLPDIYSTDADATVTIQLDPALSALENAQVYYGKYNKLKRAQTLLAEQLAYCRQEIDYLESIQVALTDTTLQSEIAEIKQELNQTGYLKDKVKQRRSLPPPTAPLQIAASNGAVILIGKNNRQNDAVTFKQARPEDLWFHAKDIPGSHVILRTETTPPIEQTVLEAARLAAYFSKARQSANVPVDFTKRRHVKKPSGAKPGFVIYDHQKTLYVTPDEQVVQQKLKDNRK